MIKTKLKDDKGSISISPLLLTILRCLEFPAFDEYPGREESNIVEKAAKFDSRKIESIQNNGEYNIIFEISPLLEYLRHYDNNKIEIHFVTKSAKKELNKNFQGSPSKNLLFPYCSKENKFESTKNDNGRENIKKTIIKLMKIQAVIIIWILFVLLANKNLISPLLSSPTIGPSIGISSMALSILNILANW